MPAILPPWTQWRATDELPCAFSPEAAADNAAYLGSAFPKGFITSRSGPARSRHPMLRMWDTPSVNSFLYLNGLAEDLRLLQDVPLVSTIVRDLRDKNLFEPTRHTLRTAGLFERGKTGSVIEFMQSPHGTVPDFVVDLDSRRVPVEAKRLEASWVQEAFAKHASSVSDAVHFGLQPRTENLAVTLLLFDALKAPGAGEVASAIAHLLTDLSRLVQIRSQHFRLFCREMDPRPGMGKLRRTIVMAPIHEKDYLRICLPVKKASKQLRAYDPESPSGIMALELGADHDPHVVSEVLRKEVRQGRWASIGAFIFSKSLIHLAPPARTLLERLSVQGNSRAASPLLGDIPLLPFDGGEPLHAAEQSDTTQPSYRFATEYGVIADATVSLRLFLPVVARIPNALLEGSSPSTSPELNAV